MNRNFQISHCVCLAIIICFTICCSQCSNSFGTRNYNVFYTDHPPKIDGLYDSIWSKTKSFPINGQVIGDLMRNNEDDLSGEFRCLHDKKYLYFFIDVRDDICNTISDSVIDYFEQDNIEIFMSNSNRKLDRYNLTPADSIYYFCFSYGKDRIYKIGSLNIPVNASYSKSDKGYRFEIRIFKPEWLNTNNKISFNIELTDNDNIDNSDGMFFGRETTLNLGKSGARMSILETRYYSTLILLNAGI